MNTRLNLNRPVVNPHNLINDHKIKVFKISGSKGLVFEKKNEFYRESESSRYVRKSSNVAQFDRNAALSMNQDINDSYLGLEKAMRLMNKNNE